MDIVAALTITMTVFFYAPEAGGINGDLIMADGTEARIGYCSCGPRYAFGTVFELLVDMRPFGMPQTFECRDRGGKISNYALDLVIRTGDLKEDLRIAREWGKRRIAVRVWQNWEHYVAGQVARSTSPPATTEEASYMPALPHR